MRLCKNCQQERAVTNGRCKACSNYYKRNLEERPEGLYSKVWDKRAAANSRAIEHRWVRDLLSQVFDT